MPSRSTGRYFETEVLTAAPQKLKLMLIEAAVRFAKRAKLHWQAGEDEQACESLIRAQQVVAELLAGLNREAHPQLVGKVAAEYAFVYRSLMEASLKRDARKVDAALRVLEIEAETWRRLCRKIAEEKSPAGKAAVTLPPLDDSRDAAPAEGFSLEA